MMGTAEITPERPAAGGRRRGGAAARLCGAMGAVALVTTPLTWLLSGSFGWLVGGKLALGTVLVGIYLTRDAGVLARLAGARSSGLWALSYGSVACVVAAVAAANVLAYAHPVEIDLTADRLYTLSPQTVGVLQRLKGDVEITAFYPSHDAHFGAVDEVLRRYAQHSARLHVAVVDPQARPDLVEKFQITERGARIVVACGAQDVRAKDPSEQELTYAIIRATEQGRKKVYFLTGHGEADAADGEAAEGSGDFAAAIAAEGYEVAPLDLTRGAAAAPGAPVAVAAAPAADAADAAPLALPADAAVLVALPPRRPLSAPEAAALEAYLDAGGRLLVFAEPHRDSGLTALLRQWKVVLRDDVVVDTNPLNRLLGLGAAAPMVQPMAVDHPIVRELGGAAVMPTARSLEVIQEGLAGVDAQALAHTGASAWGETHIGADGTAAHDADDHEPPLELAVAASRDAEGEAPRSPQGRLVVFGDADWVSNRYLGMQGNQDLALNALHWAAEHEEKISIRPRSRPGSQLLMSGTQLARLKFLSMDIMPMLLLATGLGIVLVRRQR